MRRSKKNYNKRHSNKLERSGAEDIGGKTHVGSGNTWSKKSDFSNEYYLVADKFTEKDYYSIKLIALKTLENQANRVGKIPVFRIVFEPDGDKYAILRESDCIRMLDFEVKILDTMRKSIRLKKEFLKDEVLNTFSKIFIVGIIISDVKYYVLRWEEFLIDMYNFIN